MSFDFLNTFATDFGERLKIEKDTDEKDTDKKETKDADMMEIDEDVKEVTEVPLASSSKTSKKSKKVPEKKDKKERKSKSKNSVVEPGQVVNPVPVVPSKAKDDIKFDHSMEALIISGVNKGRLIEVRYILPANFELEIGVNSDIKSSEPLEKGQIIDHCVVLAKIGVNKYLGHCKKILFLDNNSVKHIKDDMVIINKGEYKGVIGRVIRYTEAKIGGLLNLNPIILNQSKLFFNDVLLKNGKHFQVNRVDIGEDGSYIIYGMQFGNTTEIIINFSDILEMFPGFKIYDKSSDQIENIIPEEDHFQFDLSSDREEMEQDEESEEPEESEELEELGEFEDFEEDSETERPTNQAFSDKMRVFEERSLSKKKKMYYDIIKKILDIKNIGIDDIGNVYDLVDEIENVLDKISDNLKISGINFDITTSLIDLRMIIACMVAYKIVGSGQDLGGFKSYISELYENGIFVGNVKNSILLNAPDVFACSNLKKTKIELEKIEMLMVCFDKELQDILNLKIRFEEIMPINLEELIPIKRRVGLYEKRKFSTMEDIRKGEIPSGAKKMVWSGKQMLKIKSIKEKLDKNEPIDNYIYENIENAPILLKNLRADIVQILFKKFGSDFISEYDKCNEEKCRDLIVHDFLKKLEIKNEMVDKYLKLANIVSEIMDNSASENDVSTMEENIRRRFKTLGIDNSNLIKKK